MPRRTISKRKRADSPDLGCVEHDNDHVSAEDADSEDEHLDNIKLVDEYYGFSMPQEFLSRSKTEVPKTPSKVPTNTVCPQLRVAQGVCG